MHMQTLHEAATQSQAKVAAEGTRLQALHETARAAQTAAEEAIKKAAQDKAIADAARKVCPGVMPLHHLIEVK